MAKPCYICIQYYKILTKDMAQFTPCIRNKRSDGYYPVYIRLSHNYGIQYIKTNFIVNDKGLKKVYTNTGKAKIEISDRFVLKECLFLIDKYAAKCNNINTSGMDCKRLLETLTSEEKDLSFSEFANKYLRQMINDNRERSADNYKLAYNNLRSFIGKDDLLFRDIPSKKLLEWIESMMESPRKRNLYPTCIKTMITAAMNEYNDYDNDIVPIKYNPFSRIKIPKNKRAEKRSVQIDVLKTFFSCNTPDTIKKQPSRMTIAKDVCMLIFCLAGINAADLYDMEKSCLDGWTLKYKRKKTRDKSDYEAYMEIKVPEIIRPLFSKYEGNKKLFSFADRYNVEKNFIYCIDKGCKEIMKATGINTPLSTYVFRHSWATIAQNDCGASTELVAFSLNHASAHKVTEGYIRKSYDPIDKLNEKVITKVFS